MTLSRPRISSASLKRLEDARESAVALRRIRGHENISICYS
jgi:hypothetical protein